MMKSKLLVTLLLLTLASCAPPTAVPPEPTIEMLTPEPRPGDTYLDTCTHTLSYPPELVPQDVLGLYFEGNTNPDVYVIVEARRRAADEEGRMLEEIAAGRALDYGAENVEAGFEQVTVTNYMNEPLEGLRGEFDTTAGERFLLLVVIQPESLLMDAVSDDVVYEILAVAPSEEWESWRMVFNPLLESFHPCVCGGV
jgi:hypothetical protein